jgi:adenosylcobinamide kinase/adenosylcobinamide-phosphate guanylyltransferase
MAQVSLILGGARSGKSARALVLAGEAPHVFIATAEALDGEMQDRIGLHQVERGESWWLVEEPLELPRAIRKNAAEGVTMLVDCLTLWLSNLMHHERDVTAATEALVDALAGAVGRVVLVSNEVGMGLVSMNALGRDFRDAQGRLNQRIADVSDHVEFVVAGLPMVLKGAAWRR